MSFGNNLKLIRKEKGLTQEQLAELLDVSRQSVSKWESDNGYPETEKLLMIAKNLNVSLDYLMDHQPADQVKKDDFIATPIGDNNLVITTFDGSQAIRCLSVKYEKIAFPAKNEPAFVLEGIDRVGFFGAHSVILGWYENEEAVKNELKEIVAAMNRHETTYELKHFTDIKFTFWGTASRKK